MKAPDKIYLNIHPDWTDGEDEPEVTWSEVEDPFYNNVPYIRKDVLINWLKEHINDYLVHGRDIDLMFDDIKNAF